MTDTPASDSPGPNTPPPPPRRRTKTWLGPGLALAVIAVALSLFVLPTHAARWILADTMGNLGLEIRGVETVEVDLWGRQLLFGPVEVAEIGSDAPPARVERIGLILSYAALFERRGLTEDAVIEGIALDVSRDADGRITVNGMDLFGLLRPGQATGSDSDTQATSDAPEPWGAGLDAFELRDSRITFTDRTGGEAVMQIDRLRLEGFRSWDPETPGTFDLVSEINDMTLTAEGEATPFADRIDVTARTEVDAVSIDRIERFTGPLPLTEGDGTLSGALDQEISLRPDGTIAAGTEGTLTLDSLRIGLPDGPRIGFRQVTATLDTEKTILPDGSATVTGDATVSGARARLTLASGPEAALESAELRIEDMALRAEQAQRRLSGKLDMTLNAAGGQGMAGDSTLRFARLEMTAGLRDALFDPAGAVEAGANLSLTLTEPRLDGTAGVGADRLTLALNDARLRQTEAGLGLRGAGTGDIASLSVRAQTADGPVISTLERLALTAETLEMDLSDAAGLRAWRLGYGLEADGLALTLPGEPALRAQGDTLRVSGGRIDSDLRIDLESLALQALRLTRGDDGPRLSVDRAAVSDAVLSAPTVGVVGDVTLSGLGADIETPETGPARFSLETARAERLQRTRTGRIGAARILLRGGSAEIERAMRWTGGFGSVSISELSGEPASDLLSFDETALDDLTLRRGDGQTLSLDLGRLTLARGEVTTAPALRLTEMELAGLKASATSALLDLLPSEGPDADPASSTDPPPIWIGRLTLADPADIALTDTRHSPPVVLNTVVEALAVRDFDTTEPASRPQVELDATLNDFSRLSVAGWARPLGPRPNFDLTIDLTDLALPTFSPYAAKHLGVNLETGRLSAQVDGEVIDGVLDALARLDIRDLDFSALTPEDRERLSATAGMPVETAVGLLQDSDGRIALDIPIQGDIDDPQFELDQVVNKAIGSAVAGAAKTTLQIVFPPALLITAVEAAAAVTEGVGVRLAPAPFDPGTTAFTDQGRTVIQSLGDLLKQRPKLTVTVCGRATQADMAAVFSDAVEQEIARRERAYADAQAAYATEIAPLIEDGLVDEDGRPLTETPPADLPSPPEPPELDPGAVAASLAETALNESAEDSLRDRMVALATERTRVARLDLAERQKVEPAQVAECRPTFDPDDTAPPRLSIDF